MAEPAAALAIREGPSRAALPLRLYAAIFLITLSGLLFEIALTRIFSATIWYHFAFVAISVALLGWGLGGLAVHALRRVLPEGLETAGGFTLAYALSIPGCLWFIVKNPFHPERLASYFAASLLPFLLAGMALSMVFDRHRSEAGRLYFADLLGASLGALLVTLLLSWLGGEGAVLTAALLPAAAALCLSRRLALASGLAVLAILAALGSNERTGLFKIRSAPTKGMYRHMAQTPGTRRVLTGWNSYSRIDAVTGFEQPYLARLYIDSDAWTNVLSWDGNVESAAVMRDWYRALPFRFAPRSKTLVIGPGGGSDVLVALVCGAERVTAVEMNPLMLRFVRHFGAEAGNLYDQPRVEPILSEGRNFISRTDRKFDVILLGFVDSWASVASGGLSLSENYLYTTEAFRAYYDHLSDDGMLVIMRWDVDIPRLVSNSVALLGAPEAAGRIVALLEDKGHGEDPPQMIFMLRRRPFTEAETAAIVGEWKRARPVVVPGRHVEAPYDALLSGRKTLAEVEAESAARVDPVFDDRPFFFARQKPWGIPGSMSRPLLQILLPVLALCVAFVALGKPRGQAAGPYAASVLYFASLGLGFISVELSLLQHLTLLLGHPIFTLSVLLFTLLLASGIGSRLSHRFAMRPVCLAVTLLGIGYAVALPRAIPVLMPLSLPARVAVAVALIAPLGFAMGMPFPRGLAQTGRGPFPAPPFYWGLNGILSVIGSIATVVAAVTLGFRAAMALGSLCYLVAAAAAPVLEAPREAARP
jgi:predicted membrane-bound spermidine synthase